MILKPKIYSILTAGGSGTRFAKNSTGKPKQFQPLLGKPVIVYSMLAFQRSKLVDEIIISADSKYFDLIHTLAVKHKIKKLSGIAEGGKTRFESVRNAFNSIENARSSDLVLIHDAARPNISPQLIQTLLKAGSEAVAGCRISDTVKRTSKGYVTETLNRENLYTVQTPQLFRYGVLKNSYKKSGRRVDFTDESSLVENAGYKVKIVESPRENIKITTPGDIKLLKKLI